MKKNISNYICDYKYSVKDAMIKLENHGKRFLCVLNKKKLVGVITDGDIRRAILKGLPSSSPVHSIMNRRPVYINSSDNINKVESLMQKNKIDTIPVLSNKKLKDIIHVEELFANAEKSDVVILAGGYGKRLYPLTKKNPKPLVPIGKKKIIDHVIDKFILNNFNKINLITHYKHSLIKKHLSNKYKKINIKYYKEKKPMGTCGGLKLINKNNISENFLVINCDVISGINFKNLLSYHVESKADLSIVSLRQKIPLSYGKVNFKKNNQEILSLDEKPLIEVNINGGIYVMNKRCLNLIKKNQKIDMPEFFKVLKKNKFKIKIYPCHEHWFDIGTPHDLKKFKLFLNSGKSNEDFIPNFSDL